jgi:hypothetical protein
LDASRVFQYVLRTDSILLQAIKDDIDIVVYVLLPTQQDQSRLQAVTSLLTAYVSSLTVHADNEDVSQLASRIVLHILEEADIRQPDKVGCQVLNVYDRLPRRVLRQAPRLPEGEDLGSNIGAVPAPAFRLAKPSIRPAPYFALKWPAPAADVLETHRLMHLAYTFSASGLSLCMFGIDAQGETWDVARLSLAPGEQGAKAATQSIWDFAKKLMARAAIEWRLAIVRLGSPVLTELKGVDLDGQLHAESFGG